MPYAQLEPATVSWLHASTNRSKCAARRVGILLFDGFSLLGAGLVAELFQTANECAASDPAKEAAYDVRLLSVDGGSVACSASVRVWTDGLDPRQFIGFDVLFIAGGAGAHAAAADERLLRWLRVVSPRTPTVRPIAEGRAVLAAAGVLKPHEDEHRHPVFGQHASDESGEQYELVRGALTLIKRDLGLDVARAVGTRVMPAWTARLMPRLADTGATSAGDKIRAAARWLHEHCEQSISVSDAAQVAAMSERNFLRRFKLEMGVTPSDYLLHARLDTACSFLAETELPVDKVARRCGMGNGDRLAKIFRKRMSISPTEYRQRSKVGAVG
ncbi:GlxA family transcriptional regulator [Cupriavidus basilensis]|uniref:GlxA family transcriptional regulator n=1 Tax=Cupriavidus basilensis TaxID=68895 RepID=UPI0005BB5C95|nr:helix-turn-helix domain-containing protein [Cupriavidus basilensis]